MTEPTDDSEMTKEAEPRLHPIALWPSRRHPFRHEAANSGKAISAGRIRGLILRSLQALLRMRRRRATIRFLEGLGDDALKDIGLHRSEIRSIVHNPSDRLPRLRLDL